MDASPVKQAIAKFFDRLGVLFRAKAASVIKADNALKWLNRTRAQTIAYVREISAPHIANRNNVHVVTPAQVNTYSKEELDTMLGGRIPSGVLPISRYGALNFLPVGVSGSYEGAIQPTNNLHVAMNIEDDGTLVMLRAGTDGGTLGIYYSYVLDPLNPAVPLAIRVTSRQYAPAFLVAAGRHGDMLYRSTRDVVFGRSTNAALEKLNFVAITGGTFDDAGHVGAFIPNNLLPTEWYDSTVVGEYNCSRMDVVMTNGRVYFLNVRGVNGTGNWVVVFSIDVNQIRAGNITEVRQETGWQVTNMYGEVLNNQPNLLFTSQGTSANVADKPWIHWETPAGGSLSITMVRSGASRAQVHGVMENGVYVANVEQQMQFNWTVPGEAARSTWNPWLWGFCVDFVNKKAWPLEQLGSLNPLAAPMKATVEGVDIVFTGKLAARLKTSVNDRGTDYLFTRERQPDGSSIPVSFISSMNWWGSYSHALARRKYAAYPDFMTVLNPATAAQMSYTSSVSFAPQFGGAFGRRFGAPIFLGGNKIMIHCEGNLADGRSQELMAYGDVGFDTRFQHPTLDGTTMPGAAPRAYRQELGEFRAGLSELTYSIANETKLSDLNTFTTDQTVLSLGYRMIAYRGINQDLTYSHTLTITAAYFETLRAAMKAKIKTNFDIDADPDESFFRIEWHIPRTAPAFIACTYMLTNGRQYNCFILAEPNTKNGTITGVTWDDASIVNFSVDTGNLRISTDGTVQRRGGSMSFIESDNYWFFTGHGAFHLGKSGSSAYPTWRWALNKSTRKFEKLAIAMSDPRNASAKRQYIPGLGMGITRCSESIDLFSKLVYTFEGATETELLNYTQRSPQQYVMASMLKPAQWNVSFTEPTDVILAGRKYVLEPVTYFLSDIVNDPANKTFYVYVRLVAGKLVYSVQLDEVPESAANMFIGTIVTGPTSIASLNIVKVTRLGNYRPSTTAIGSAIPVSQGSPRDLVPLSWH